MNRLPGIGSMFDRRSIRYPLVRLILAAALVGVGLALMTDAMLTLNNVRRDIQRTLTAAANAAGTAASAAVAFRDAKAAGEALRMFDAYPEVTAAAVYAATGDRLATFGDAALLPQTAGTLPPTSNLVPLANTATLHLPIVIDNTPIGTVYLQARLDAYWRAYGISVATTFIAGIGAAALALLLAMRFLDRIIRPIRELAEAANDARLHQNFNPRPIPTADNEIGDLVRNFNALLEEIDVNRKFLQTYQERLEYLVAERTAELAAAKDAAEQANLAKSRFLAAASHDLRQPIQAIRLFQDVLAKMQLNDEQRRVADYIAQSTRSLAEILNALLDVSKLDGGMVKPHPETVNARALFENIEAEFAPLAAVMGLNFRLFLPARELTLYTDPQLMYGLLRNLIDNAIKYTKSGGILVGLRQRDGRALVQIWDTGIGIASHHVDEIFDEYFQVDNPQRDSKKGLGLGLAIAKRTARILGSEIVCKSRPGKGSVFEVCVPLAAMSDAASTGRRGDGAADSARSDLRGRRIVVVEDDPMAAKAIELALAARGLKVDAYASAEDALAAPDIGAADFYLADFRLPGLDGVQLLEAIQARAGRSIRAALLTGETFDPDAGLAPPRWRVLLKPVDLAALLTEIEAANPCVVESPRGAGLALP